MSSPQVNTAGVPYTASTTKQDISTTDLPVDSAVMQSPQSSVDVMVVNNIETRDAKPVDEKEKRLADYVSKMDELRMTTGEEGYKIQQGIKVKTIVKGLLQDSDTVCWRGLIGV
jgi:hypothetical protein